MSSSQLKLLIEPSSKAAQQGSFIQGFPGIPPSHDRPPARIAGVVHLKAPPKGINAAWLRIELRKNETIPPGDHWAELIGRGPIDLWTAPGVAPRVAHATANKGPRGKMEPAEEPEDWQNLTDSSYPFVIPIPEGLPPSARIDKQSAITYDLVASLCIQTKKGLLKKEFVSSVVQAIQLIVIEKHELHSMHPIYHVADEHAASTAPSPPNEPTSIVSAKVYRNQTCYGPGDTVNVRIIVSSDRISAVKLRNLSFAVRETITFRGGSGGTTKSGAPTTSSDADAPLPIPASASSPNPSAPASEPLSAPASVQRTNVIASKSKSINKKMYKGDKLMFDLSATIPKTHALMSVATAKHIGVSYTMRVVVDLGGGDKATSTANSQLNAGKENAGSIVMDHLPMTVTNFLRSVSEDIVRNIGHVDGLSAGGNGGAVGLLHGGPDDDPAYATMVAGAAGPPGDQYDQHQLQQQQQYGNGGAYPPFVYSGGGGAVHPGSLRRSHSIAGSSSTLSAGGLPPASPTTPTTPMMMNALRRSDSQRTTGTTLSGPGLAGRGVPGQLFHWTEDRPAPVRTSAFVSGPGSIYHGRHAHSNANGAGGGAGAPPMPYSNREPSILPEALASRIAGQPPRRNNSASTEAGDTAISPTGPGGRALNQAELNALFHHTDRADSAAQMLGLDPTLFVNDLASYSGFRAGQKIRQHQQQHEFQHQQQQQQLQSLQGSPRLSQLVEHPDLIPPSAPASIYSCASGASRPPTVVWAPNNGGAVLNLDGSANANANLNVPPKRTIPTAAEVIAERARVAREQAAMAHQSQFIQQQQQTPAGASGGPSPSAYGQGGSTPPTHQRNVSTSVIRGPGIALNPGYQGQGGSGSLRPSPAPTPTPERELPSSPQSTILGHQQQHYPSAEDEKRMLYERARAEAEMYQAGAGGAGASAGAGGMSQSASFPPRGNGPAQQEEEREEMQEPPTYAPAPAPGGSGSGSGSGSGPLRTAVRMNTRPQSMMELSGSRVPAGTSPLYVAMTAESQQQQQATPQHYPLRSDAPSPAPTQSQGLPMPPVMFAAGGGGAASSAETEKEQMRRFYEARDAVERYQAGASGSGSGSGLGADAGTGSSTAVGGSSAVAAGGSYAAGTGQTTTTQLQRKDTAFFEPYETAPVPSYGKVVEEDRQQLQQRMSNPLMASMHDPQVSQHAMEESSSSGWNEGPLQQQPVASDWKGKGAVPGYMQQSQPAFATSGSTLPAPISLGLGSGGGASSTPLTPPPAFSHGPSGSSFQQQQQQQQQLSVMGEKEQMRLYYAARDMQAQAGAGGSGSDPSGAPPSAGVVSPTPAYAPGFAGTAPPAPATPVPGAPGAASAVVAPVQALRMHDGPVPAPPSSVLSQGMSNSRPPPLPASLLGAASGSSSSVGPATGTALTSGLPLSALGSPSSSSSSSTYAALQPQPGLQRQHNLANISVPQLPPFGSLYSPMSFTVPPPPSSSASSTFSYATKVGPGPTARAGSSLSRAPTMPRRAFEEENYTDAAQSAAAVPPPRPPKAGSALLPS
ncbi:hypothetical protein A4X06_0g2958 [Tilletia controversa]|uniref:Arrestin C-terminal-like domain-containing protein n=1 Tax=Tilletia controversa TaxID=13291 RepID=A0A8X7SYF2_9BASI|nr:hypothetical protein CF328_g6159 [Tilletia controversa]KAE8250035.1 hypothetical protein A4X06_0g2958 [Tilletia controversa]